MITRRATVLSLFVFSFVLLVFADVSAQEKRLGRHTVSEWRALVDSTWGPGPATGTYLPIFDFFWDTIDKYYGGFPYLAVNWDSLKALYRPEVEAGVTRGRFSAIMNKLYFSLQDIHAWIVDGALVNPKTNSFDGPAGAPTFAYEPGTALFWPSGWGPCGVFGAALTPLPDNSLLVYKAIDAHPLGLTPGDVILGYDRIPWKQLYSDALAADLPLGFGWRWGSAPRSMTHSLLTSAGNNWGLFDTVEVVKYVTGDTVHLPTAPLSGLHWEALFASEQLPVPGVKMPDYLAGEYLTYGVVEGTSIGYIYVYWWNAEQGPPFKAALYDLLSVKKVTGLVLDFRFNVGSLNSVTAPDQGFDLLFSENPAGASRWRHAMRNASGDHFGFAYSPPFDQGVTMQPDYYDRPIAVLTGPAAWSMGDMHSFRLRSHPMVRFFGLPTNGAFCVPNTIPVKGPFWGSWYYQFPPGQMESLVNDEGLLMHKSFPVDEEVWLTRDGVAKGEDDVAKRAFEWITSVTHAHSIALDRYYGKPGEDSATVTAVLANPLSHVARVSAVVSEGATVRDSVLLYNDGLHRDGPAGDTLWGARLRAPAVEGTFYVNLQTDDLTEGTFRKLTRAAPLTTAGPLMLDSVAYLNHRAGGYCELLPYVKNTGKSAPFVTPTVTLSCRDSAVSSVVPTMRSFYTIAAGVSDHANGAFILQYDPERAPDYFKLTFTLGISGRACWDTTLTLMVPPGTPIHGLAVHLEDSVSRRPLFSWAPVANADRYRLELATGEAFSILVADTVIQGDTTCRLAIALEPDAKYRWQLTAGNNAGYGDPSGANEFTTGTGDVGRDVEQSGELPTVYALEQNYPNPFNPTTTIRYALPHRSYVKLTVFNLLGEGVATLANGEFEAGYHEVTFDASGLASGVYFYRIQAADFVDTKKIVLVR